MKEKGRIEYYDFLRGIAILMVVANHTSPPNLSFDSFYNVILIIIRQIINCAVPLFLAISGFFMYNKRLETRGERVSFWNKQIMRVYIPMLMWSMGWFVISIIHFKELPDIIKSICLLITGGFNVYYFVILIIQCYLILPFLQKKINGGG